MNPTDYKAQELLYEGKSKLIYATQDEDYIIIHYKDDASAYNGIKRAQINNKGVLNNKISSIIYQYLESKGIKTHFVARINDREQLCRRKQMIPIEFIAHNIAAGSHARRLGLKEGFVFPLPVYEMCYKNDELDDPIINSDYAVALNLCDLDTCNKIQLQVERIRAALTPLFKQLGIQLVDFKSEFGLLNDGTIVLADELSPDTCRLWDAETKESLDRDRFRRDLGRIAEAYTFILNRLETLEF